MKTEMLAGWAARPSTRNHSSSPSPFMNFPIVKITLSATLAALVAGCASSGVKNPSGVGVTRIERR